MGKSDSKSPNRRPSGDENWSNWWRVARFVKVFEIERVIVNLIKCGGGEFFLANFEFKYENYGPYQK